MSPYHGIRFQIHVRIPVIGCPHLVPHFSGSLLGHISQHTFSAGSFNVPASTVCGGVVCGGVAANWYGGEGRVGVARLAVASNVGKYKLNRKSGGTEGGCCCTSSAGVCIWMSSWMCSGRWRGHWVMYAKADPLLLGSVYFLWKIDSPSVEPSTDLNMCSVGWMLIPSVSLSWCSFFNWYSSSINCVTTAGSWS